MIVSKSPAAQLQSDGWTLADGLLDATLIAQLRGEVRDVLDRAGVRRDMRMPSTAWSPRRYTLASRASLADGRTVPALYRDTTLIEKLSALAGETLIPVPYEAEEFIATRLDRPGDTHGWHWDDYAYAFVIVLHAPSADAGGAVGVVPDTRWDKDDPAVERYLCERCVTTFAPQTGQAYLLRADTTMHCVLPLEREDLREVLTFSYARAADPQRAIAHETLDALLLG